MSFTEPAVLLPFRDAVERARVEAPERERVLFEALLRPLRDAVERDRALELFVRLPVEALERELDELDRFFWAGFFACVWAMLTLLSSDSVRESLTHPALR